MGNRSLKEELERMMASAEERLLREFEQQQRDEVENRRRRKANFDPLWQAACELRSLEPVLVQAMEREQFHFRLAVGEATDIDSFAESAAWEVNVGNDWIEIATFRRLPDEDAADTAYEQIERFTEPATAREYLLADEQTEY